MTTSSVSHGYTLYGFEMVVSTKTLQIKFSIQKWFSEDKRCTKQKHIQNDDIRSYRYRILYKLEYVKLGIYQAD